MIDGTLDGEFPLVVFQTGSGTQSNMNANEVIANRAIQLAGGVVGSKTPIHPNDDVNRGQSSNDTFPAVMHIATRRASSTRACCPRSTRLRATFDDKARAFADVVMIGRTHLQDATPVTLGQVISGWVGAARRRAGGARAVRASSCFRWRSAAPRSAPGSTRIRASATRRRAAIARETGKPFVVGAATSSRCCRRTTRSSTSAPALRTLAGALMKIANDVRWYASGPRAGLGEISIPDNEPGSSIMPGKINPTQCEALTMVARAVFGNDAAVAFARLAGQLPAQRLQAGDAARRARVDRAPGRRDRCRSTSAARAASSRCATRIAANVERSLMLVTALNPHIGYENAAKIALQGASRGHEPARGRARARASSTAPTSIAGSIPPR